MFNLFIWLEYCHIIHQLFFKNLLYNFVLEIRINFIKMNLQTLYILLYYPFELVLF